MSGADPLAGGREAAPERIYLQLAPGQDPYMGTWCDDRINDDDVEYVRAPASSSGGPSETLGFRLEQHDGTWVVLWDDGSLRAASMIEPKLWSALADAQARVAALEAELRLTEALLADRQRVLDAIPACEAHGSCVPHALKWIERARRIESGGTHGE